MKRVLQILLPVLILGVAAGITTLMFVFRKEPPRRQFQAPPRTVEVRGLEREDYRIMLPSQGTVQARTTSTLIPEVRGRIVAISPNFREGGFFEEGDVLVEIDRSDYETELVVAEAAFAQAELKLAEEQARARQAKRDWERLNPGEPASTLTLREPQLKQAAADVASAEARLRTAQRNLERASLRAPFAGRVLSKSVDVGQYVAQGNTLAQIYAVDFAEVRLPLTGTQFAYLDLPEIYRGEQPDVSAGPEVELTLTVAGETHRWPGRIVRSEGSVDVRSRQLYVVAQVDDPYGRNTAGRPPLKVGSFVEATITGRVLPDMFIVPRNLIRENSYVLLVDSSGEGAVLRRQPISMVWQTDEVAVVDSGLTVGDQLCLTQVPLALEGYPVQVAGAEPAAADGALPPDHPIARMLAALLADKPLPDPLREQLEAAARSGDRTQMRPAMQALRDWAEHEGVELPVRRRP